MIDDKKIEEAARYYCNNRYPASQDAPFIADGFRLGAKWAVNELLQDLWHPASENPKKGRVFLYKTIFEGYGINQIIDGNEWKYIIKYQKATQWICIDDLLPKKGDEQ